MFSLTNHPAFRALRERWLAALIALLICVAGALGYYLIRPPQYTASLQSYVSAQLGENPQQAYMGAELSAQRVKSYTQFATSDTVLDQVVAQLNLPMTSDQLAREVSATSVVDSVVIDISVTDRSPQQAAAIANAVGQTLSALVDELERPGVPNQPVPVAVRVVRPAPVPATPSSSGLVVLLGYGLVAGLVVGAGVALLANALDTRVKTTGVLTEATGSPLLGVIARDPQLVERPLLPLDRPGVPLAEAFRQLRTNLQFVAVGTTSKVLMMTSSVEAEGKTTTLLNLAQTLASTGSGVLVVDADLRRPRVAAIVGFETAVGLSTVLSARCEFPDAVQKGPHRFDVVASGPVPPNPSELLGSGFMEGFLREASRHYDVVLVDTPPLLPVTDAAAVAPFTDGVVLLCRQASTTHHHLRLAMQALASGGAPVVGCVLTMASAKAGTAYGYGSYSSSYLGGASPSATSAPSALSGTSDRPRPSPTSARTPNRATDPAAAAGGAHRVRVAGEPSPTTSDERAPTVAFAPTPGPRAR